MVPQRSVFGLSGMTAGTAADDHDAQFPLRIVGDRRICGGDPVFQGG
jgi:hypothetical protein